MLRESHTTIWPGIMYDLEKEGCVGTALTLYCINHPDNKIRARKPEDFSKRPEGGCDKICGARLECGHSCSRICHVKDREHKLLSCTKTCLKTLMCNHNCRAKCYQCQKNGICLPCSEPIPIILPQCGHRKLVKCSATKDPSRISCPLPCEKKLPCGHKCTNSCSEPCSVKCTEHVLKQLPCRHKINLLCSENPQTAVCSLKCEAILECGDKCTGTCAECEQGRLHVKCTEKCGRTLVCGHACTFPCSSLCPPCMEPCNNYCVHSKCLKKCFQPCTPCMEKCKWQCLHFKCTKPCGQLCDRPPCNQPCMKTLRCGHQCIGICGMHDAKFGEKCPKKCRICDKEEVCEVFFGTEEDDGATFFHLQDCGHMFESSGIDGWVNTEVESSEIQFKACPRCKTPIRKSLRYANNIKKVLNDVNAIKLQQNKISVDLPSSIHATEAEIRNLGNRSFIDREFESMKRDARNDLNSFRVQAIYFQLPILPKILKLYNLHKNLKPIHDIVNISGCSPFYVQEKLSVLKNFVMQPFLSAQQTSDCIFELRRLTCSFKLLDLICKVRVNKCTISNEDLDFIIKRIQRVHCSGSAKKLSEKSEDRVNDLIRTLSSKYSVDGLSEKEKQQVVAAIGLGSGHWFKCPNGHYYAIGECGGAMQTSKCPECKSTIGGMNHALAQGNAHAGEFDGSRYAAWSDTANMRNFDPAELARLRL